MNCTPPTHVFHAATTNHHHILQGMMNQPIGSTCQCGEDTWTGHRNKTDGREEIEPFIEKRQRAINHLAEKI